MTLASLVSVIIRDISEIRGQILQPRISRMARIMGTEYFQSSFQPLDRVQFQRSGPRESNSSSDATRKYDPHYSYVHFSSHGSCVTFCHDCRRF